MTVVAHEANDRFYFGARAVILDNPDRETASEWAASKMTRNSAISWILGRFVEADRANSNMQYFALDDLRLSQPTILYSPMNLNHTQRVVGAYVGAELMFPKEAEAAENGHAFIECLGAMWRYYFPDEYQTVKAAHEEGSLFYSMECVPRAVSTVGGSYDDQEFKYEGRESPNYPSEINDRTFPVLLKDPHFVGGALIIPPERPGWAHAEVKQMSGLLKARYEELEAAYVAAKDESPHLSEAKLTWVAEQMVMLRETETGRKFSAEMRKNMADSGNALPDGSFPIANMQDLKNAIHAIGRAKDPAAAKAHIAKRAKALGATNLLPAGWA